MLFFLNVLIGETKEHICIFQKLLIGSILHLALDGFILPSVKSCLIVKVFQSIDGLKEVSFRVALFISLPSEYELQNPEWLNSIIEARVLSEGNKKNRNRDSYT